MTKVLPQKQYVNRHIIGNTTSKDAYPCSASVYFHRKISLL